MPKIVNHDAYRRELATKAGDVFLKHGFHKLGMRAIAEAIGVSKSALYHYFPSKQELFEAAAVVALTPPVLFRKTAEITDATRDEVLGEMLTTLDARHMRELPLMLDYLRNASPQKIAADPLMQKITELYLAPLQEIVGDTNSKQALALLLGGLVVRLMDGKQTELNEIRSWLQDLVPSNGDAGVEKLVPGNGETGAG